MLIVGLTGGIASGKTVVAARFAALGVPLVDADAVSREVVAPGTEGLHAVVEVFGDAILAGDGSIDRSAMRHHVFSDDAALRALEDILHPRIRAVMDRRIRDWAAEGQPYGIEVVPLLVETGQHEHCDRVLVVDAMETVQIARLRARDGTGSEDARAILARQVPRWERLRRAHDVVANGDSVPEAVALDPQVRALDRKYRLLAGDAR